MKLIKGCARLALWTPAALIMVAGFATMIAGIVVMAIGKKLEEVVS